MNLARDIVEDVRFIITTMVCSVLVWCGIRMLPTNKGDKERLRQLQVRREEGQDRIIRII